MRAITDYNGVNGFGRHPDIVTMNNAHTTHFTDEPEDGITYARARLAEPARRKEAKVDVRLKDCGCGTCDQCAALGGGGRLNGNSIFILRSAISASPISPPTPSLTKEHLENSAASTC